MLNFCAFCPVKITDKINRFAGHYADNMARLALLIDSLELFLDLTEILDFYIACAPDEIDSINEYFGRRSYEKLRVIVIDENGVVEGITGHGVIGWWKQQALKLAFTAKCESEFCLLLDPDIIMCREMKESDFVSRDKCFNQWTTKGNLPRADWWIGTSEVLGFDTDEDDVISVTPEMLSSKICDRLQTYLASRLKCENPWKGLLDTGKSWTEFTLYSAFASKFDLLKRFHHHKSLNSRPFVGRSVWIPDNTERYSLLDIYNDPKGGFFTVCQSHVGVPVDHLRALFDEVRTAANHPVVTLDKWDPPTAVKPCLKAM